MVERLEAKNVLEIGCGTGFIIYHYLKKVPNIHFPVGIDISLDDLREMKRRSSFLEIVQADGLHIPFRKSAFQLVFFNPPYLPSEKILDRAVDGGKDGIEVTCGFLKSARRVIKRGGYVVFIASSLSNTENLEKKIRNLKFSIYSKHFKRLFFEILICYVLKIA